MSESQTPRPDLARAKALGIAIEDADGKARRTSDIFQDIANKVQELQNAGGAWDTMNFVQVEACFDVLDLEKAKAEVAKLREGVKAEIEKGNGTLQYQFYISDDEKVIRVLEIYSDAAAFLTHLGNVGPVLKSDENKAAMTLKGLEVHGSAEEVAKLEEPLAEMKDITTFFESAAGPGSVHHKKADFAAMNNCVSIIPHFKDAKKPMSEIQAAHLTDMVNAVREKETDSCLFYGFSSTKDEKASSCREAYFDGPGACKHLGNIGEKLTGMLGSEVIALGSIYVVGPKAELEKCKETMASVNPTYMCAMD